MPTTISETRHIRFIATSRAARGQQVRRFPLQPVYVGTMGNPICVNYLQRTATENKASVRVFYGDVLGWECSEIHHGLDVFSSGEQTYGVRYVGSAPLTDEQYRAATWLSIRADDRAALVAKIQTFGVTELPEQSDENNYFFQAPGGQVSVC